MYFDWKYWNPLYPIFPGEHSDQREARPVGERRAAVLGGRKGSDILRRNPESEEYMEFSAHS